MAKVDIIIPYYNTPLEYTKPAVESVLAQTFTDWKIVFVNDGSKEDLSTAIENYLKGLNDRRIVYVKQQNKGLSAARNAGIRASDSPYIALLDSDDLWHPVKLQLQVPFLDDNPNVGMVHSDSDRLLTNGKIISEKSNGAKMGRLSVREASLAMLVQNYVAGVNSVMMRRLVVEKVGYFDELFESVEDKELYLRIMSEGYELVYLPGAVAIYRWHNTNMSKNVERMKAGRMRLVSKMERISKEKPDWLGGEWPAVKKKMLLHLYNDAADSAMDQGQLKLAFKYGLPQHSGFSLPTVKRLIKIPIKALLR